MRIKYLLTIILFFIAMICVNRGVAQTSSDQIRMVKIDQLSDETIVLLWQKAQGYGATESEIYKELLKRGMPAGQVQAFKDRVTLLGLNAKKNVTDNDRRLSNANSSTRIDYSRRQRDTVITPGSRRNNTNSSSRNNPSSSQRNTSSSMQRLSDRNAPDNRRTQTDERDIETNNNNVRRSNTSSSSRLSEQNRNNPLDDEDKTMRDDNRRDDQISDADDLDDVLRRFRLRALQRRL